MLAVEGRHELSGVEVFEGNQRGFRETEGLFDCGTDRHEPRWPNDASQDGRDFDLDLCAIGIDQKPEDGPFLAMRHDPCAAHVFRDRS